MDLITQNQTPIDAAEAEIITSKVTSSVMIVNSETAIRWLDLNTLNRPLSPTTVERYRRDIAAGRWVFAADPIRFSVTGRLLDGQHRLIALSQTPGASVPFLVVRGLPDETQKFMDQGRKRTPGQQLSLDGIKSANHVAAGVKVYIVWREGLMFRDNKRAQLITSPQIQEWVEKNLSDLALVEHFQHVLRQNDAPPSVSFAAALRFAQVDPQGAHDFFHTLASGGAPVGNPINTLDKRLQRIRREGLRMSQRDYLALFILAWNAWRDHRSMIKFQRPRGGSWTEHNFPEPK